MSLSLLPENALVGLITFGTMVRWKNLSWGILIHTNYLLRPRSMSLATRNVRSRMYSGEARITRRNRCRKCLGCTLPPCALVCSLNRAGQLCLQGLRPGSSFQCSSVSSSSRRLWNSCRKIRGPFRVIDGTFDAAV